MMSCEYLRVIYCFLKYLFHVFMFLSIAFFKSLAVLDLFFFFFLTWVLLKLCLISELAQIYLTILIDFFFFFFQI